MWLGIRARIFSERNSSIGIMRRTKNKWTLKSSSWVGSPFPYQLSFYHQIQFQPPKQINQFLHLVALLAYPSTTRVKKKTAGGTSVQNPSNHAHSQTIPNPTSQCPNFLFMITKHTKKPKPLSNQPKLASLSHS